MANALIVFASLTGNTEEAADLVAESLEKYGVDVNVMDCTLSTPDQFQQYDICVVGSYTYGEGDIPDEMLDFYEELAELDLSGKVYGVFGLGDTYYEHYCNAVVLFEEQFKQTGATRGSDSVKIELMVEDEDIERLDTFAKQLVETLEK